MYYIGVLHLMVQPKTPPISLRLPDTLLAKVDAWAERRKLTRHGALVMLVADGLRENDPDAQVPMRGAQLITSRLNAAEKATGAKLAAKPPEPKPKFATRLKGEWSPPGGRKK